MAQLLFSAAHKSSGKTIVTTGLCAALRARGHVVQPYKKGPDYIDPMWLGLAAGRPCYNLDFNITTPAQLREFFFGHGQGAGIRLIEGNKGLFDGLARDGSNSNAALARLLEAPVVLVIDTRGMTRGIAPLLLGYQGFDRDVNIAGVILNQIGGSRHEAKLRDAVQYHTDLPVLGAVHRHPDLQLTERHLGLVPSNEIAHTAGFLQGLARRIGAQVDLDALLAVARSAPAAPLAAPVVVAMKGTKLRIAVAMDSAFGFYYADDLEALEAGGAELVPFNTLSDAALPVADALFLGGGFPETHLGALQANAELRGNIRAAVEAGMPTYAECGGLMYLTRSIAWRGEVHPMVGVIPADTVMEERPQGRGLVRLRETAACPWPKDESGAAPETIPAHEFHYSRLENIAPDLAYAYDVERGTGIDGRRDGIVYRNLLASYTHLRGIEGNRWTDRFLAFIKQRKVVAGAGMGGTSGTTTDRTG